MLVSCVNKRYAVKKFEMVDLTTCFKASGYAVILFIIPMLVGCGGPKEVDQIGSAAPVEVVAIAQRLGKDLGKRVIWSPFSVSWDSGVLTHDLVLKNECPDELHNVSLEITLYREDGDKPTVKRFESSWNTAEVKKVNLPAHPYQKVMLMGTVSSKTGSVAAIEGAYSFTWSKKSD